MNDTNLLEKSIRPVRTEDATNRRRAMHRVCIVVGMCSTKQLLDELVRIFSRHTADVVIDVIASCDLKDELQSVSEGGHTACSRNFADAVIYVAGTGNLSFSRNVMLAEEYDAQTTLAYASNIQAPLIIISNDETSLPLVMLKALQGVDPCGCELISICDASSHRAGIRLIDILLNRWSHDVTLIRSIDVLAHAFAYRQIADTACICMGISQRRGIMHRFLPRFLRISDLPLMCIQQFKMLYDLKNIMVTHASQLPSKATFDSSAQHRLSEGTDIILLATVGFVARSLARKTSKLLPPLGFLIKPSVACGVTYALGCAYTYLLTDPDAQKASQYVWHMAQNFAQSCTSCVDMLITDAKKPATEDNCKLSLCGERSFSTSYIEI